MEGGDIIENEFLRFFRENFAIENKVGIYIDFENFYNGFLEFFDLDKRILVSKKVKNEGIIKFNKDSNIEKNFITYKEKEILSKTLKEFLYYLNNELDLGKVKFIKAMGIFQNLPFYENFYIEGKRSFNLRQFLSFYSVQPIIPFENAKNKNSADIKLTIDFITDLGIHKREGLSSVILFSGDSDLFPLYLWANEHLDMDVYIATFTNRLPEIYDVNVGKNLITLDEILLEAFCYTIEKVKLEETTHFVSFWLYNLIIKFEKLIENQIKDLELKKHILNENEKKQIEKEIGELVKFVGGALNYTKSKIEMKFKNVEDILKRLKEEITSHFSENEKFYFYDFENFKEGNNEILSCVLIDDKFLTFLRTNGYYLSVEELSIDRDDINFEGKVVKKRGQD